MGYTGNGLIEMRQSTISHKDMWESASLRGWNANLVPSSNVRCYASTSLFDDSLTKLRRESSMSRSTILQERHWKVDQGQRPTSPPRRRNTRMSLSEQTLIEAAGLFEQPHPSPTSNTNVERGQHVFPVSSGTVRFVVLAAGYHQHHPPHQATPKLSSRKPWSRLEQYQQLLFQQHVMFQSQLPLRIPHTPAVPNS